MRASAPRCPQAARPLRSAATVAEPPDDSPLEAHSRRRDESAREVSALESRAGVISLGRLASFLGAAVTLAAGGSTASMRLLGGAGLLAAVFVGLVVAHARSSAQRDRARIRVEVHERHVKRLDGRFRELAAPTHAALGADHAYALDLDLAGPSSLLQRIDVTHTRGGLDTLAGWLAAPSARDEILGRQAAVAELARKPELCEQLEAAALWRSDARLDPEGFLDFTRRRGLFDRSPWLRVVIFALPAITLSLVGAAAAHLVPPIVALVAVVAQSSFAIALRGASTAVLDLASARSGFGEAFGGMFSVAEQARFEAPHLRRIVERLGPTDARPSRAMRRLDRWLGLAELRTQVLLWIPVNFLLLWDLHCVLGLERWNRELGRNASGWFDAIAELEALSSLATLAHGATFAEITDAGSPFVAEELAHPLLHPAKRVANDVRLRGPGTALVVTGSNMAGKSTLLRAVGVNVVLALAGGPASARVLRLPPVRLRASMRAIDDLGEGASYFFAELRKLEKVVADADASPPVFFLLDELLRGTNAHARHVGARAVLLHLLARHGTGLVATHDVALARLGDERPDAIQNAHFTDVVEQGEMKFDYRLRDGVVRTSNALRLLRAAGIDVAEDDSFGDE